MLEEYMVNVVKYCDGVVVIVFNDLQDVGFMFVFFGFFVLIEGNKV